MSRLSRFTLALVSALAVWPSEALALNPAVCEQDVVVRPQWLAFEAQSGIRFGAPEDVTLLVATADVSYTLGLVTLGPRRVGDSCEYELDAAVDFLRGSVGYQRAITDFASLEVEPQWLLADLSWHRILDSYWRASVGLAADHGFLRDDVSATSLGGLLRLGLGDWVSLSARLGTVVAGEGVPAGGFNGIISLGIEPRLWCEHVSRERCKASWFVTALID